MRITGQYFWSILFLVFFLCLMAMAAIILDTEARIPLTELTFTDYLLITLASWRLTRLFVYDSLTRFVREQFMIPVKVGRGWRLDAPTSGARRLCYELFACPWCFGVWATALVAFCYLISDYFVYPIIILAIAGVVAVLQIITNLIGHKAEIAKRENEGL